MTTDSPQPLVSVIMPVFNGEAYLRPAVESVLGQTIDDFEFLIVDDGCTDRSVAIIESFDDIRIRLLHNETNQGLVASLNRAFGEAKGRYLARMDADDFSLPERLEKQVAFLRDNSQIGACGTLVRTIGDGRVATSEYPLTSAEIRCRLLFDSALAHPTVMFRRELLEDLNMVYDPDFSHAEDFELWSRLSRVTELANIGEVLLLYRQHHNQVTNRHQQGQSASRRAIYRKQLERLGLTASAEELSVHEVFHDLKFAVTEETLRTGERWLCRLLAANNEVRVFASDALKRECAYRWYRQCDVAAVLGWPAWKVFRSSALSRESSVFEWKIMRFLLKIALRWRTQGGGRFWKRIGRLSRARSTDMN